MAERRIDPKFNIHKEYKRMFIMNPYRNGGGMNPLTEAFILSTGITNSAQIDALNTMEQGLIDNGLIPKMKALYPFAGGTAHTHKFNFMDARDLDAAYRLTYVGSGQLHSSNGFNTNKVRTTTNFKVNDVPQTDAHLSYYSRSNTTGRFVDMGSDDNAFTVILKYDTSPSTSLGNLSRINSATKRTYTPTRGDYYGIVTRNSVDNFRVFDNGVKVATDTSSIIAHTSKVVHFGGLSNGLEYGDRECAFASIGLGLTDSQALALYTIVQTYNTALGRAISR